MGGPEEGTPVSRQHQEGFARRGETVEKLIELKAWCYMPWRKHHDRQYNLPFWTHQGTGESTWIRPEGAQV